MVNSFDLSMRFSKVLWIFPFSMSHWNSMYHCENIQLIMLFYLQFFWLKTTDYIFLFISYPSIWNINYDILFIIYIAHNAFLFAFSLISNLWFNLWNQVTKNVMLSRKVGEKLFLWHIKNFVILRFEKQICIFVIFKENQINFFKIEAYGQIWHSCSIFIWQTVRHGYCCLALVNN